MRKREPVPPRVSIIGRALSRATRGFGFHSAGCATITQLLAFLGRIATVSLGLADRRILVVNRGEGREADGFYAQFTVILGLLEHLEAWPCAVEGVRVDFGDWGMYYDPAHGANAWEYYFEPIGIGRHSAAVEQVVNFEQGNRFSVRGELMPRTRAHELIARYIHVKPRVAGKIDAFVRRHLYGFHVIGVHYRGTDKWTEARRVPYDEVIKTVRTAIGPGVSACYRLFVASDEQAFVDEMKRAFPGRVVCWETLRSVDGSPIDFRMGHNYKKGEEAVIDCLPLSRCDSLIRTPSHPGNRSTFFSPDLPVELLTGSHPVPEAALI